MATTLEVFPGAVLNRHHWLRHWHPCRDGWLESRRGGFFILGLDEDDEEVFERTLHFAQEMRLESAQFAWPIPYPGTVFYESLDKTGRIVTKDWSQYESNLVFEPKLMSRETLQKQRYRVWRDFYSLPSILRRVGMVRRNSRSLWTVNLYFRAFWRRKLKADRLLSVLLTPSY